MRNLVIEKFKPQSIDNALGFLNYLITKLLNYSILLRIAEIDHHRGGTEPVRLIADVEDSDREPDAADGFGDDIQVEPDQATEKETNQRQNRVGQNSARGSRLPPDGKLPEAGEIHSHESQERTEIQQFSGVLISAADRVQHYGPKKRQSADQQNVVGRSARARFEPSKKLLRQNVVASHAEQQASRTERAGQSTAKCRDNQNRAHGIK